MSTRAAKWDGNGKGLGFLIGRWGVSVETDGDRWLSEIPPLAEFTLSEVEGLARDDSGGMHDNFWVEAVRSGDDKEIFQRSSNAQI